MQTIQRETEPKRQSIWWKLSIILGLVLWVGYLLVISYWVPTTPEIHEVPKMAAKGFTDNTPQLKFTNGSDRLTGIYIDVTRSEGTFDNVLIFDAEINRGIWQGTDELQFYYDWYQIGDIGIIYSDNTKDCAVHIRWNNGKESCITGIEKDLLE